MAENDNGRLNFSVGIDLDDLQRGADEAKGVFDGIASEAQAKGADIDRAFGTDAARGASSLSSAVRQSLSDIGRSCSEHEAAIAALEGEYSRLGKEMSKAYETGRDGDLQELQERATAVKAEISVRKELLSGLREQADELEREASKMEDSRLQTEALGESHSSLRQRIRELQEQMAQLREQGIDETSGAYRELTAELGRLRDIQSDIQKQGSVLANDQAQFQGIISGLQGISGGYTAVSGAMSLFGTKNEDLNKIMAKAQSLMSITIGLQQVSQMLDKDSAFQLTTVAKVREWWNSLLDVGRGKTAANTAAVELNTAAQKGNAGAVRTAGAAQQGENIIAETGTAANIGLAGAFRMVGAAIKSIPVFGWIATAITAIVTVTTKFISKAKEAREKAEEAAKAQEEWNRSVAETAADPVAAVMKLRAQWNALGDDLESKQKFIRDNAEEFRKLGVAIRDVNDAEREFTSTETLQKYINAQLVRAKADKTYEDAVDLIKKQNEATVNLADAQEKLAKAQETPTVNQRITTVSTTGTGLSVQEITVENPEIKKYTDLVKQYNDEAKGLQTEIDETLGTFTKLDKEADNLMGEIGAGGSKIVEGSIADLEKNLKEQQDLVNNAVIGSEEYIEAQKRVAEIQAQLDVARGKTSATNADKEAKELENALTKEGKIMATLTKQNEQGRISLIDDAHKQNLEKIDYEYNQEIAEIKKMAQEVAEANKAAGVDTEKDSDRKKTLYTGLEGFDGEDIGAGTISNLGLTADQTEAFYTRISQLMQKHERDTEEENAKVEEENRRHAEEEQNAFDRLLRQTATYEQRRDALQQEYLANRKLFFEEDGETLKEGVSQGNVDIFDKQYTEAQKALAEECFDEVNALAIQSLQESVDSLAADVETAKEELEAAKAEGGDSEKLAAAKKKLTTANKELKTATKNLSSEQKSQQKQQRQGDNDDEKSEHALGQLGNAVGKCGDAFEEMGDAIGGSVGDAFTKIGQVTSAVGGFLNSIDQFVTVGIEGMKAASAGGVSAIKTVESASTILAMIGAIMQIAQAIASLFGNGDDKKEEEIQALQERIDDLQWELDNAEAARVRDATGGALSVTSQLYQQALSDAKAANSAGRSYISMLSEWTSASNRAKASDVAHEKTVQGIIKTYTSLGYTVDKAIGEDKYKAAGDAVKNYAEQLALTYEQYEKEQSKKKTDTDKLKEYEQTMDELAESMVDTLTSAVEDIIGGSYEDISKQLGDAFVEAFQAGEDAAEAWGDTVEDIVNDIVRQMLIQQWIEPKIAEIFDKYQERWFNSEGEYAGNQAVVDSMADFSDELNAAMDDFSVAWAEVSEAMGWAADSTREAASQGIAAASQESIDELNGRMTAIQGHTFSINDNVAILVTTNGLILQSVTGIEDYTALILDEIRDTRTAVRTISGTVDDIQLKGLRVK